MIPPVTLTIDPRDAAQFVQELRRQRPGFVPEWLPGDAGADAAILQIAAQYFQAIVQRLNHAPDKNKLAFLDMLGFQLLPARPSRAPMVFLLNDNAADIHLPAGTRVAAPPPPGSTDQIIFETQQAAGLSSGKLQQVFSVWPGRDEYIDHSAAAQASQPFQPFLTSALQNSPHQFYLGHDTLLALAGSSTVTVKCELTVPGSDPLDIIWAYWDGQIWREFLHMSPECSNGTPDKSDSTGGLTRKSGSFTLTTEAAQTAMTTVNGINTFWIRGSLTAPLVPDATRILPQIDSIKLSSAISQPPQSLKLDKAFSDQTEVDLTKTFYPFGQQPQPGATFYFTSQEAFSKPNATVTLDFQRVETPQDTAVEQMSPSVPTSTAFPRLLAPVLAWEYWNGNDWVDAPVTMMPPDLLNWTGGSADFDPKNLVLTVPQDLAQTTVNNENGLWMRARLVSGGFGVIQQINLSGSNNFYFTISQPPAVAPVRLGYSWGNGPYSAEHVLTFNDFQYEDCTEEATWPGDAFQPFQATHEITPALYLGFTDGFPVDNLGICFDIVEQRGDTDGPALVWEYWNGSSWFAIIVVDETQALRLPGLVSYIGPEDAVALARFGTPLYWLRARLKEDGPPGEPTINGIYPNAVWALQNQTIVNEPIGASTGQPDQVFAFRQIPVLEGEIVIVRESAGARAEVEWRIIALDVFEGDQTELAKLEALVEADGPQTSLQQGDVTLTRDKTKTVTEVWVRWYGQPDLFLSGPKDRDYVVERANGKLHFGDGINGAIAPMGAAINAQLYQSGGGLAGNVPANGITQLLGPVGGIEETFNPRAAEGGGDGQTLEALAQRGPEIIRCNGRALLPEDFEAIAYEANATVALARAIPCRNSAGRSAPGWVTVVIIPQSTDPQPVPTFGLREEVSEYIAQCAPMGIAAANQIFVTGPNYVPVDVAATIVPLGSADAGGVEADAKAALEDFLHPLRGGPNRQGWPPGRAVFASDIALVLGNVAGVDYVEELELSSGGVLQNDSVPVTDDGVIAAGNLQLKLVEAAT
jgi:hypothetical protein